ncbi:trigger factor family protein, partial [Staphylococcus aureus]|uniref:trigger factor family protein n=1 Tax=Staphylococcus aureus TaxID=1280 RepID=UPI001E49E9C9
EVELEGEIEAKEVAKFRARAIKNITREVEIPGVRKGHATEAVIVSNYGEEKILLEMAELALQDLYPKLIEQEKIDALGRPNISITKLAKD